MAMMHNETLSFHNKTIDRFSREKLYIQLARIFLDNVLTERWKLSQKIPTEQQLCSLYDVSKITVRQAINYLASDGYLMKIQGKGTFVTSVQPVLGLSMRTRFSEEMFGEEVTDKKEILYKGVLDPPAEIREYLRTIESIFHLRSKRTVNGEPAYLDDSFVPCHMLPGVERIDFSDTSLFSLLQEQAIKKIFKVIQTVEVVEVCGESATDLDLKAGIPALAVHRLLLSSDNTPVAYTRFLGRSDRYKFQTEFERIR
jgi:GntR family transcriptional regulator